jgi:hypothetical protein
MHESPSELMGSGNPDETDAFTRGAAYRRTSICCLLGKQTTSANGAGMPIKAEMRWLFPIDWPQLSNHVRSERVSRQIFQEIVSLIIRLRTPPTSAWAGSGRRDLLH